MALVFKRYKFHWNPYKGVPGTKHWLQQPFGHPKNSKLNCWMFEWTPNYFHHMYIYFIFYIAWKPINLVYLSPVSAQNEDLITPSILQIDILIIVMHAWYTNNNYCEYFHNSDFIWAVFPWKPIKLVKNWSKIGPKLGSNYPPNPANGYFSNGNACMV